MKLFKGFKKSILTLGVIALVTLTGFSAWSYVNANRLGTNNWFLDEIGLWFGNLPDAKMYYNVAQTPDTLTLGVSAQSNAILVTEMADMGTDVAHAVQTNPTLFIHSEDITTSTEWISITHDGTNGVVDVGTGVVSFPDGVALGSITMTGDLDMDGNSIILDAGATSSITADTDNQIDFEINSADDFQMTANLFAALSGSAMSSATYNTLSAGGTITLAGLGGAANDEDLVLDFETVADAVGVSSSTGVLDINFGTIDINPQDISLTGKIDGGTLIAPIDVTAVREYGVELYYGGNNYNVTGLRSRGILQTTDTTATAQGAVIQASNSDDVDVGVLNGALIEAIGKSDANASTITAMRGLLVGSEWSAFDTITDLKTLHVRTHTRNSAAAGYFSNSGYLAYLENEAVGGNGQMLDAGIYLKATNVTVPMAFNYGIDFTGAVGEINTAELRLSNGETIDNVTDGTIAMNIAADGAVGINLDLYQLSTTPAALDVLGSVTGRGQNDAAADVDYGVLGFGIVDPSNGAEIGGLAVSLQNGSGALPTNPQFEINGGSGSIGVTREADGAEGAALTFTQVSVSPVADDALGMLKFVGYDDGANVTEYAQIRGVIVDPTDAAEIGGIGLFTQNGTGTLALSGVFGHTGSYGIFQAGDGAGSGIFASNGDFDLILETGNATSSSLTITDGADGNITLDVNGAGVFTDGTFSVDDGAFTGVASIVATGDITSSDAGDIGWSIVAAGNQACNTTCTFACVAGQDDDAAGILVNCASANADRCICAGAN